MQKNRETETDVTEKKKETDKEKKKQTHRENFLADNANICKGESVRTS